MVLLRFPPPCLKVPMVEPRVPRLGPMLPPRFGFKVPPPTPPRLEVSVPTKFALVRVPLFSIGFGMMEEDPECVPRSECLLMKDAKEPWWGGLQCGSGGAYMSSSAAAAATWGTGDQ